MEIVRNVARHKLRSFLTISGIVIGVLALTTMGALAENFNALLNGGVQYFGSNVQVGPPVGQAASLLPLTKIDEIKQVPGVAAAFPTYGFSAKPGAISVVSFGVPDTIVAARAVDLRDVGRRVLRSLAEKLDEEAAPLDKPVILIAEDLSPSDTAQLDPAMALGLCTASGGATSQRSS